MIRPTTLLLSLACPLIAGDGVRQQGQLPPLVYHDRFKESYPELGKAHDLKGLVLEDPLVVMDSQRIVKATVVRTDGAKVPFGKSLGNVSIEGVDLEPRQIAFQGFRSLKAEWVGSNLLYFYADIGHVAGVECLLDVRAGKWLYIRSISYNKNSQMKLPGQDGLQP